MLMMPSQYAELIREDAQYLTTRAVSHALIRVEDIFGKPMAALKGEQLLAASNILKGMTQASAVNFAAMCQSASMRAEYDSDVRSPRAG